MKKKIKAPKSVKAALLKTYFISDEAYDDRWHRYEACTAHEAFREFVSDASVNPNDYDNYVILEYTKTGRKVYYVENTPGFTIKE